MCPIILAKWNEHIENWQESCEISSFLFSPEPWIYPSHNRAVGVNQLLRPSLSDQFMDYNVSIWKIKVTAVETCASSIREKSLFQMTDIRSCVETLWHGYIRIYNHKRQGFHWNYVLRSICVASSPLIIGSTVCDMRLTPSAR